MTLSNLPPLVTVFGGSGFVGRHVVRALAKRGFRIRVAVRRPDLAGFLQPLGNVGQISSRSGEPALPQIGRCGRARRRPCRQLRRHPVRKRPQHLRFGSGFWCPRRGRSRARCRCDADPYLRHRRRCQWRNRFMPQSKGRAEKAILETVPDAVILRPSIIFGPEDGFFNKFAEMARFSPVLPLVGGGNTEFQPVYVADVAEAVARTVEGKVARGRIYELGGPEVLTFKSCLEIMLKIIDRKRTLLPVPFGIASMIGSVASMVPFVTPPITADQVILLKRDNVVSDACAGRRPHAAGFRHRADARSRRSCHPIWCATARRANIPGPAAPPERILTSSSGLYRRAAGTTGGFFLYRVRPKRCSSAALKKAIGLYRQIQHLLILITAVPAHRQQPRRVLRFRKNGTVISS